MFALCATEFGQKSAPRTYARAMNKFLLAVAALTFCSAAPIAQAGGYAPVLNTATQPAIVPQGDQAPEQFVRQPAIAARLQALIGPAGYQHLLHNMDVQSQLQNDARTFVITGCRQHDCPANGFVLAYDRLHDALRVWRVADGHVSAASEATWHGAPLHGDTLQYIRALGQ